MIRKFDSQDADALVTVWRAASAVAHPFLARDFLEQEAANMRSLYLPNAETWVSEKDGKPVGFIALLGGEIGGLFLDPALHGTGMGKAMVDHAADLKGRLKVEVFQRNAVGRRFYDRYGFAEIGRHVHEASCEVVLRLQMPES